MTANSSAADHHRDRGTSQKVVRSASQRQLGSCWRAGGRATGDRPLPGPGRRARPLGSRCSPPDPTARIGSWSVRHCSIGSPVGSSSADQASRRTHVPGIVARSPGRSPAAVRWRQLRRQAEGGTTCRRSGLLRASSAALWRCRPVVAAAAPRGAGRPTSCRPARRCRLRPVRLFRLRHRHPDLRPPGRRGPAVLQLPHHGSVLADPGLPADRSEPPHQRHGSGRRDRHRLPRLRRPHPQGQRLPLRDAGAHRATPPSRWANGTWPRRTRCHRRRPRTSGRSGGASSASTASWRANPPVRPRPDLRQPPDPPAGDPEEGYHLTEDLVDQAIAFVNDLRAVDARQALLPVLLPRRLPRAAPGPAAWIERYRGAFRRGWDAGARQSLARQLELGVLPRRDRAVPGPTGCRPGPRCATTSGDSTPGSWRSSPAS